LIVRSHRRHLGVPLWSFVRLVADARTLVITAARADRSSFGCEDRRPWTYFGDAYFNQALRHEESFTRAFEDAKRTIARWERAERLTPSLPRIAGGQALPPPYRPHWLLECAYEAKRGQLTLMRSSAALNLTTSIPARDLIVVLMMPILITRAANNQTDPKFNRPTASIPGEWAGRALQGSGQPPCLSPSFGAAAFQ
jgi:hypothetical protein